LKTGVFSKVKKTLQKMTFTPDSDDNNNHNLALMNVPALMGRRDAAYDRTIELLEQNIFSHREEERIIIYDGIMDLLKVAIDNTKSILTPSDEKETIGAMLQYLNVLNDSVLSASVLAKHELILFEDERDISSFIGKKVQSQFRSADKIFSNSEMNIFHSIAELIEIAMPAIKRYRQFRKRTFSKTNLDRYNKAFKEFYTVYQATGILGTITVKGKISRK